MSNGNWLWAALAITMAVPAGHANAQPARPPAERAPAAQRRTVKAPRPRPAPAAISPATLAALSGTDVEAAAAAADLLGTLALPAAHDALLDALALGLAPAVAVHAIQALATHPAPPDVSALARYGRHQDPTVRSAAISTLALYPSPAAHAIIIEALRDPLAVVRAAAASASARGRVKAAIEPLFLLLARGEDTAARALAELADPALAATIASQLGKVPVATLALALGAILKRTDFGPDPARVEVVRAIAKIQDPAAVAALTDYIDSTPASPPRPSREEAMMVVEARLGGK